MKAHVYDAGTFKNKKLQSSNFLNAFCILMLYKFNQILILISHLTLGVKELINMLNQ